MIKLVDVLKVKEIREGIQSDLGNIAGIETMETYIEETMALNKNCTNIVIQGGEDYEFKCTLHEDQEKELYLLESRLFKVETGQMINGYLMVLYKDLSLDTNRYDDVWEVADWKEVMEQCV